MADNAFADLIPKKGGAPSASGNAFGNLVPAGPSGEIARARRIAEHTARVAGAAVAAGHKDPLGHFLDLMGAGQRGLESLELSGAQGHILSTPALQQAAHAVMTPSMGPALRSGVKQKIGLTGLEAGPLAGSDLPHKVARGTLDTALDIGNDPMTFAPVGKIAEGAAKVVKAVPGATALGARVAAHPAAQAVSDTASYLFNPEHYMRGLTPKAKAEFEVATNRAMEAVRARQTAEDAIVARNAEAIRAGKMPDEVARLFQIDPTGKTKSLTGPGDAWKQYFTDKETGKFSFGPGTRPQDVQRALFAHRAPMFEQGVRAQLPSYFADASSHTANKSVFHVPDGVNDVERQARIAATQERLLQALRPVRETKSSAKRMYTKGAQMLTKRGNQAFLVNPIPHTFNLSNLAYNRYGVPTVVRGLVNAARVATGKPSGKLGQDISELEGLGAKSQYGNLYDELGLTRLLGIPGTEGAARAANKVIVPAERLANYAQHKILNSTETGLRAAALNAEKRAGTTGAQAAKNIHATFGTDAPNSITEGAVGIGAPFAKFHLQTAPGSGLRTLARHPARVVNPNKAQRDENAQINPSGAQYHATIPAMSVARLLFDPYGYTVGNLGPLTELKSPYGLGAKLSKGDLLGPILQTAGGYTPGAQQLAALWALYQLQHKGQLLKMAPQAVGPAIFGGYYKP
jgi:hypothetical protein